MIALRLLLLPAIAWALAALWIDAGALSCLLLAALVFALAIWRRSWLVPLPFVLLVLLWWSRLAPSQHRHWRPELARLAHAEIAGDRARIYNIRNFSYRSEEDPIPRWEAWEVEIGKIRGVDLFVSHWGSPWIAHALVSFDLGDDRYLTASIEARKETGEGYSALLGFFRQYELIHLLADERDVVRLRTNYRSDEEVRLYRTRMTPQDAQLLFREYLRSLNELHRAPQWYNALSRNCTSFFTRFLLERNIGGLSRWDWRLVLNGRGVEALYEKGLLQDAGLSLPELEARALINRSAQASDADPAFSRRIRAGRF